jgi:calcineurin-like phosphoesterase family protein
MQIYAIGDIHGQLDMLKAAHDRINSDIEATGIKATVVHLGDLVDRGPDSRGVIEYLTAGIEQGQDWIVLRGNHDRMFQRFVETGASTDSRISSGIGYFDRRIGGVKTLESYGVSASEIGDINAIRTAAQAAVPAAHLAFIRSLPLMHRFENLLFVHAGIRPGVALEQQSEDDLIWIREGFLNHRGNFGPLVVHGHTALFRPLHYGNRVDLDSAAGFGEPLTAAVFDGDQVFVLTDMGREPIEYADIPTTHPGPDTYRRT